MTESESAEEYLKKHLLVNLKPNKIIDNFVYHKDALRAVEIARKQDFEVCVKNLAEALAESKEVALRAVEIARKQDFEVCVKNLAEALAESKEVVSREVAKKIFEELDSQIASARKYLPDDMRIDFSNYEKIKARWVGEK